MEKIQIRRCSISDVMGDANIGDLADEYAEESAIPGMPRLSPQWDIYRILEEAGHFHIIGAFEGERLVGLMSVISQVMPHYGAVIATIESIFVLRDYRKTGAGIVLLRAAAAHAKETGAVALLATAPKDGALAKVLPRVGYTHTNQLFCRIIA